MRADENFRFRLFGWLNKKSCSTDLKFFHGTLKKCMVMKVRLDQLNKKCCLTDLKIVQGT